MCSLCEHLLSTDCQVAGSKLGACNLKAEEAPKGLQSQLRDVTAPPPWAPSLVLVGPRSRHLGLCAPNSPAPAPLRKLWAILRVS